MVIFLVSSPFWRSPSVPDAISAVVLVNRDALVQALPWKPSFAFSIDC